MNKIQRILVIKLGALGDFIQAASPFMSIRVHHRNADITLLTTSAFYDFAAASPWFDNIKIDKKPKFMQIRSWLALRTWIREAGFSIIYDLQTSDRSNFYYKIMQPFNKTFPKPDWSGTAFGCSYPHDNPDRNSMHTIERHKEQLKHAGIEKLPDADFSWVNSNIKHFNLAKDFVLIAAGGASHRPAKRWPIEHYDNLIQTIASTGIQSILIGSEEEREFLDKLSDKNKLCISLAGQTKIFDLFGLAKRCRFAIGNDTGPMHIAAACNCKTIILYSSKSNPELCAQRGKYVTILQEDNLENLLPEKVLEAIEL